MIGLLVALSAALGIAHPVAQGFEQDFQNTIPTINLSAIRYIYCENPATPGRGWTGSGSLIAKNTVVTAYHVVSGGGKCYDQETDKELKPYKTDKIHDIALLSGDLPVMPYIKYSCQAYKPGYYYAYGITAWHNDFPMFRQSRLKYRDIEDFEYNIDDNTTAGKDIAVFDGATVHGMSGGPYMNELGYQIGIVNAGQDDILGLPVGISASYSLKDTFLCK